MAKNEETRHADTARSAALMPDELCPIPCEACGTTEYSKTLPLLRIARDQMAKAIERAPHHEETLETAKWRQLVADLERVARFEGMVGEWVACLQCDMAFPSISELNLHYRSHRR